MQSSKRGFALIELLVVIAIIAILAAVLFPFFAKVPVQNTKLQLAGVSTSAPIHR